MFYLLSSFHQTFESLNLTIGRACFVTINGCTSESISCKGQHVCFLHESISAGHMFCIRHIAVRLLQLERYTTTQQKFGIFVETGICEAKLETLIAFRCK